MQGLFITADSNYQAPQPNLYQAVENKAASVKKYDARAIAD
jgi:hypothetical protein